jgi:hypothetical protein
LEVFFYLMALTFMASPILDSIDISYKTVQFNGNFTKETIYRELGNSGHKADEAWLALGVHCKFSPMSKILNTT